MHYPSGLSQRLRRTRATSPFLLSPYIPGMLFRTYVFALLLALGAAPALAQQAGGPPARTSGFTPQTYEVLGLSVEGVSQPDVAEFVKQSSAIKVGQQVAIPGDPAFSEAVRALYRLGLFSDVRIENERTVGSGVFLVIHVKEEPRLGEVSFENVRKKDRDELRKQVPLIKGNRVRASDVERARMAIRTFYAEKGHLLADVEAIRTEAASGGVNMTFKVNKGPKVEVTDIRIAGNESVSDRRLRKRMKETKEDRWWRFWKGATFKQDKYEEDLQSVVDLYNQKGYYDAQIVRDTFYVERDGEPGVRIELQIHEGPRYFVRNVTWEGNTVYPDALLNESLGIAKGDAYNAKQIEQNLYANKSNSDVTSIYTNRGYMRFNAQPTITVVEGDSLDIAFDVYEGDVYSFGQIEIAGNTKTKEHVIRRELQTVPGQTFSREAIQESMRRLQQLSYFDAQALSSGLGTAINEQRKTVDLSYKLNEVGSDQLELSGTWGRFGLVLMLRFGFNNFSLQNFFDRGAWKPLPSGDGQKLSIGIQTNGRYYQSYSLSFTEPWFRSRPTPIGFSLSHSRLGRLPYYYYDDSGDGDASNFITTSGRLFYDRRLKFPDPFFSTSSSIGYQYYFNDSLLTYLPQGVSQEITLQQSLSRNSLDNPLFPMRGSSMLLSLQVAPPLPGFIQYHKWRYQSSWNFPLAKKLSLGVSTDYGYIGSLTGDPVTFERFDVGGSPFETQGGYYNYGTDIIYMRGYPRSAIGPRLSGDAVGGTILNKYTSEIRWLAIQTPQLQAAPYLFLDAANTWNSFKVFNPADLYRAAGVGARLFLPIVGMLEITYGYNFDAFEPAAGYRTNHEGDRRWYFQFSLGQGFGQ